MDVTERAETGERPLQTWVEQGQAQSGLTAMDLRRELTRPETNGSPPAFV